VVWRAGRVDPYGLVELTTEPKIEYNLRWPGHYFDPETGLHYNRYRYYDPKLGRYLQSDPIGHEGSPVNLYAYCPNPLVQVDVLGLAHPNKTDGGDGSAEKSSEPDGKEGTPTKQSGSEDGPLAQDAPHPKPKGPQKSSDLDQLYKDAAVAQAHLSARTLDISAKHNGEARIPPTLKGRARAEQKIHADYGGDASRITDLSRSSMVFKNEADLQNAAKELESTSKVVKVKDRFVEPVNGYRDKLYTLEMPNGHVVETQLHLEKVLQAKDGQGHALYEQQREILARGADRPSTADELRQVEDLNAEMKKLYDAAYEASKGVS
jgi:RHS repeat-associated protein